MSRKQNEAIVKMQVITGQIDLLHEYGAPLLVGVDEQPFAEVGFEPYWWRPYGRFVNRAPRVIGDLVLSAVHYQLPADQPDDITIALILGQDHQRGYAFHIEPEVLDGLSGMLGRSLKRFEDQ